MSSSPLLYSIYIFLTYISPLDPTRLVAVCWLAIWGPTARHWLFAACLGGAEQRHAGWGRGVWSDCGVQGGVRLYITVLCIRELIFYFSPPLIGVLCFINFQFTPPPCRYHYNHDESWNWGAWSNPHYRWNAIFCCCWWERRWTRFRFHGHR